MSKKPFNSPIRLNRYIAACGITSRRKAEYLIKSGKIKVNGNTVTDLSFQVTSDDSVKYNGQLIQPESYVYLMLNKPKNVLTTKNDEKNRQTVFDWLSDNSLPEIFSVGRLDRNTSGVLILTNDGNLANRLMHPSQQVEKVYKATVDKPIPKSTLEKMAQPQYINKDYFHPHSLILPELDDKKRIAITIHTGQNRIVRRMFKKWGFRVKNLDRLSYAGLKKNHLKPGEWRYLKKREINILKNKAGLKD